MDDAAAIAEPVEGGAASPLLQKAKVSLRGGRRTCGDPQSNGGPTLIELMN